MKRALALAALATACGRGESAIPPAARSPPSGPHEDAGPRQVAIDAAPPPLLAGWLSVQGNRILLPDGEPFHGRGASVHDTRSCDACAWEPPHVEEVERRIDALVDDWHANFVRVLLESYPGKGAGNGRVQWQSVLDDPDYFHDVMRIVGHAGTKRGVYVLLSLWHDPSFSPMGWPTERTRLEWKKLAGALRDMPFVMFGVANEPEKNEDGARDPEVWRAMNDAVQAIREVENPAHPHVVTVQGTRGWGRSLDYYVEHPITAGRGKNVAYETHVYDPRIRFDAMVTAPAKKLPVIIGELGVVDTMSLDDVSALMDLAEQHDIPWLAYTFHPNCPPTLVVRQEGSCGVGASLDPSPYGRIVKERLARPW